MANEPNLITASQADVQKYIRGVLDSLEKQAEDIKKKEDAKKSTFGRLTGAIGDAAGSVGTAARAGSTDAEGIKNGLSASIASAFIAARDATPAGTPNYAQALSKKFEENLSQGQARKSLTILVGSLNQGETKYNPQTLAAMIAGNAAAPEGFNLPNIKQIVASQVPAPTAAPAPPASASAGASTASPQPSSAGKTTVERKPAPTASPASGKTTTPPAAAGKAPPAQRQAGSAAPAQPPAAAPSAPAPQAAAPAAPQIVDNSEFGKFYDTLTQAGAAAGMALGGDDAAQYRTGLNPITTQLAAGIKDKISAELKAKGIEVSDTHLTNLANTSATSISNYLIAMRTSGIKPEGITTSDLLDAHSTGMAREIRSALLNADIGELKDDKYLDMIVGISAGGKQPWRYGPNLLGLSSGIIAQTFGTEQVANLHHQQMAQEMTSAAVIAKGGEVNQNILWGTVGDVTANPAVLSIVKKTMAEDDGPSMGDKWRAFSKANENDMFGGMWTRIGLLICAMLGPIGDAILNMFGVKENPLTALAGQESSERRVRETYDAINGTSVQQLGVSNETERTRLAEQITGLRKQGDAYIPIGKNGEINGFSGLNANIHGLNADGTVPDTNIQVSSSARVTATGTQSPAAPAAPSIPEVKLTKIEETKELAADKKQGFVRAVAQLRQENKDNPALQAMLGSPNLRPTLLTTDANTLVEEATTAALKDGKIDSNELKVISGLNQALKDAGLSEAAIPVDKTGDYSYVAPTQKPQPASRGASGSW